VTNKNKIHAKKTLIKQDKQICEIKHNVEKMSSRVLITLLFWALKMNSFRIEKKKKLRWVGEEGIFSVTPNFSPTAVLILYTISIR
jgi:hypothetical protein